MAALGFALCLCMIPGHFQNALANALEAAWISAKP